MFYNLFKALIIGRIGSVETIGADTDKPFHKLSVAANGFSVNRETEEKTEKTTWVEVLLPGKVNIENFRVGRSVLIEGVPSVNAYIDKDGKAVGKLRIQNAQVTFQDAKPADENQPDADGAVVQYEEMEEVPY